MLPSLPPSILPKTSVRNVSLYQGGHVISPTAPTYSLRGYEDTTSARRHLNILITWYNTMERAIALNEHTPAVRRADEQRVFYIAFHEACRQVMVTNPVRGKFMLRLWLEHTALLEAAITEGRVRSNLPNSTTMSELPIEVEEPFARRLAGRRTIRKTSALHASHYDGKRVNRKTSNVLDAASLEAVQRSIGSVVAPAVVSIGTQTCMKSPVQQTRGTQTSNQSAVHAGVAADPDTGQTGCASHHINPRLEAGNDADSGEGMGADTSNVTGAESGEGVGTSAELLCVAEPFPATMVENEVENEVETMVENEVDDGVMTAISEMDAISEDGGAPLPSSSVQTCLTRKNKGRRVTKKSERRKTKHFQGFTIASIDKSKDSSSIEKKDLRWVLKNIDSLLAERITMRSENRLSPQALGPFVFHVFLRKYGLGAVASMHIKPLLKSVCLHAPKHCGVRLFERFLRKELDNHEDLEFVLDVIEFCNPIIHGTEVHHLEKHAHEQVSKHNLTFPENHDGEENWVAIARVNECVKELMPELTRVEAHAVVASVAKDAVVGELGGWKSTVECRVIKLLAATPRVPRWKLVHDLLLLKMKDK